MTKRNADSSWMVFLLSTALLFAGCAEREEEAPVPIRLTAGSTALSAGSRGAGVISPKSAFSPTFIASLVQEDFATKVEWSDNALVDKDGKVTLGAKHYYPAFGDWVYIVGVHPQTTPSSGSAVYDPLDGTTDVMYAAALKGNKWDSERFAGNTLGTYDKTFRFTHLLTQLQVKAKKADADGLAFTITKITVKGIAGSLSVALSDGVPTFGEITDTSIDAISSTPVTVTEAVSIANLLLPPSATGSFMFDIETSAGRFKDVAVFLDNKESEEGKKGFQAGCAHQVILTVYDKELGVSVSIVPWESATGGNIDLVD